MQRNRSTCACGPPTSNTALETWTRTLPRTLRPPCVDETSRTHAPRNNREKRAALPISCAPTRSLIAPAHMEMLFNANNPRKEEENKSQNKGGVEGGMT